MKPFALVAFLTVCSFALTGRAGETGDVVYGTVELPDGFKQVPGQGTDSTVGDFVSADGKLVIHYDIGGMAGVYARPEKVKDGDSYTEFPAGGRTAAMIVSGGTPQNVTVSIGSINFFAEVQNNQDIGTIKKMAASFTRNTYPRDNVFKRLIGQYIADEQAGEKKYQKPFWLDYYRKLRAQTSVGWEPTDFKSLAEMIEYIKQQRLAHKLPTYDD